MKGYTKWSDLREEIIAEVGAEAYEEGKRRIHAEIRAHRLAEKRKQLGMTQAEVAELMGVSKGRVSQIERGEVATVDVLARYVHALGGDLRVIADFHGDQVGLGTDLLRDAA